MSVVYSTQLPTKSYPNLPLILPKMRSEGHIHDRKVEGRAKTYLTPRENTLTCHTQISTVATTTKDEFELAQADAAFDYAKYQKSYTLTIKTLHTNENEDPKSITETGRPKLKRMHSILKKAGSLEMHHGGDRDRVDVNGVPIVKGSKKHTLTFEKKIHTVSFVENWKEFNKEHNSHKISCGKCYVF